MGSLCANAVVAYLAELDPLLRRWNDAFTNRESAATVARHLDATLRQIKAMEVPSDLQAAHGSLVTVMGIALLAWLDEISGEPFVTRTVIDRTIWEQMEAFRRAVAQQLARS